MHRINRILETSATRLLVLWLVFIVTTITLGTLQFFPIPNKVLVPATALFGILLSGFLYKDFTKMRKASFDRKTAIFGGFCLFGLILIYSSRFGFLSGRWQLPIIISAAAVSAILVAISLYSMSR